MGIKKDMISKIFDSFVTTTRNGSGLGLYFCKTVMLNLGGDITCESEYEQQTTFTLYFPKFSADRQNQSN